MVRRSTGSAQCTSCGGGCRYALRLLFVSIAARLRVAMLRIGVLVHVQRTTGSFAITGAVSGALAIAQGVGGAARPPRRPPRPAPGAGRFGRGRRERPRRHGAAARRSAVAALLALAAAVGFATPPVRACLRALLPSLVG